MNTHIAKWGPLFVLLNSIGIVLFALGGVALPLQFWTFLNIDPVNLELARIMSWYLLVLGIGGLLIWRDPSRHPVVLLLIGLEKLAPAILFPILTLQYGAHWLVLGTGVFDGVMAVLFICYSLWIKNQQSIQYA
ncbi:hypothetical protein GCM10007094_43950 [Pseudovibrio japonicus]|uniref:Uncharacterized protein n=1 Tax=Pseudovibrio japonicus TaxID=366534 RepID=A0ABQ3EPE7_9HYPH|nr:hypothetical protein [Pseudovibrio japonicus]GHB49938.1 hypothetical protein GCM10007094_43950 [Pseudovibrio japonicus]